jgi:hypothetical protein
MPGRFSYQVPGKFPVQRRCLDGGAYPRRPQQEIPMTHLRIAVAAALLSAVAFPALAADNPATANNSTTDQTQNQTETQTTVNTPMQNNAQAGTKDVGKNAAPNTQTAMNTSSISSEASSTQRKGMRLNASQRSKADAAEAETTKQLNQQAAAQAAPSGMTAQ